MSPRWLERTDPERAKHLLAMAQADADERWRYYEQLAYLERSLPREARSALDEEEPT